VSHDFDIWAKELIIIFEELTHLVNFLTEKDIAYLLFVWTFLDQGSLRE